jgi:hypothetical protein
MIKPQLKRSSRWSYRHRVWLIRRLHQRRRDRAEATATGALLDESGVGLLTEDGNVIQTKGE